MKKITLLLFSFIILVSCGSLKKTKKAINSGQYDKAISLAIENLKKGKDKKRNQPYVLILEEAYLKATERDLNQISFLEKEANPAKIEEVFNFYKNIENRQNKIKSLLPLYIKKEQRVASFPFKNYSDKIVAYKQKLISYLYDEALKVVYSNDKLILRKAYDDLRYIEKLYPNYKNTRNLIDKVHAKGVDYVFVAMKNETEKIIPKRLMKDLLDFDTYGLNDIWTMYHARKDSKITYDYKLELNLRRIDISPEQIKEKEIIEEKQLKEGKKYLLDNQGNFVKDSLGNKIKVDKFIKVSSKVHQITQFKSARVVGVVKFFDYKKQQYLEHYPLESEFVFEHIYANYSGDKRAIRSSLLKYLRKKVVPFPSNEQMIYDAGTDLKDKLKRILKRNKFRN